MSVTIRAKCKDNQLFVAGKLQFNRRLGDGMDFGGGFASCGMNQPGSLMWIARIRRLPERFRA